MHKVLIPGLVAAGALVLAVGVAPSQATLVDIGSDNVTLDHVAADSPIVAEKRLELESFVHQANQVSQINMAPVSM